MSKETREHISSLMDGEIGRDASRFLVRRLGTDDELGATWARYHIARDCLRDPDGGLATRGLRSRISKAIRDESPPISRRLTTGWMKPVAGVAIAASVALMAVLAVGPGHTPDSAVPGGDLVERSAVPFNSPQGIPASSISTQAASNPSVDRYILRHYQATGANNGRGLVSVIPLVVARNSTSPDPAVNDAEAAQAEAGTESPRVQ